MAKQTTDYTIIKVRIYGVSKKWKVKPFYSCPAFNPTKSVYMTGQENMTEAELAKEPMLIDPLKNIIIRDGDELTLERDDKGVYKNTVDYVKYRYFLLLPEVAKDLSSVNKQRHYFYLDNKEEEAVKVVSIGKLRAKAYEFMKNIATLSDMRDILFYIGENANNFTHNRAEALLYNKCNDDPLKVIAYFEDESKARIVFVKKCLSNKLLSRSSSNYIMYGNNICGANEIEAAAFLYNDSNSVIYSQLYDQLSRIEGTKK